ncbi:Sec-independent protein translocase TatB [Labedella populi]|uniref:Sec-independent protein translocase TatB n=1 Tax=Labedella populi TaxID=2498850 RepID=A0A444QDL2_9MICO|nr:Sec-independent protein translocase TatB [Labedella populi]RWZ64712.1 Sec-independent protein translocase TatB [Labedella populi]
MFGLTPEKVLLIAVIAVLIVGPERLPLYASKFAQFIRWLRDLARGAQDRMREEMGPEFDEVDWKKLDPRQYDPRRIIKEALLDDEPAPVLTAPSVRTRPEKPAVPPSHRSRLESGEYSGPPPFDAEST